MAFTVDIIEILHRKCFLSIHTTCLEMFLMCLYRYRWIKKAVYTCWQWFPYFTCQNWPYSSSDLVGCFVITITTHQQMNEFSPLWRTLKTPVYKQTDNLVIFSVKSWSGTYIQLFQSDLPSQSCDHPCQPCCCCCSWNNTTQHNRVPNAYLAANTHQNRYSSTPTRTWSTQESIIRIGQEQKKLLRFCCWDVGPSSTLCTISYRPWLHFAIGLWSVAQNKGEWCNEHSTGIFVPPYWTAMRCWYQTFQYSHLVLLLL
jgi:hypothetical protein